MDISLEMIHSLLPLFIVITLGISVFSIGQIEGLAESTALIVKVFSGVLSDYLGKRKRLAVFGYALGALMARFSEAFLVLRSQQGGIPVELVPLVMVAMNVIYAASAYPFGKLSDRISHKTLLVIDLIVLIAADMVLAVNDHWKVVLAGVALWGIHMGITQGLLAMMVADTAPPDLHGTAYGLFSLISGIAMLVASVVAGLLWDQLGASFTFYAGTVFCIVALAGLAWQPGHVVNHE